MRSVAMALACAVFSLENTAFAQSAPSGDIEIGEASAPPRATAPTPSGPVIRIGEPEPAPNRAPSLPLASQPVYVSPEPELPAPYSAYAYPAHPSVPLGSDAERARRRFQRMGVAGGVILSSLLLITVIGGAVALAGRPTNGIDVAQGWLTFAPVVGPAVGGALEIAQVFGNGGIAAILIIDALGQAAGAAMLIRGVIVPASTRRAHPRERVQWNVTPWIGSASGLSVTLTTF